MINMYKIYIRSELIMHSIYYIDLKLSNRVFLKELVGLTRELFQ